MQSNLKKDVRFVRKIGEEMLTTFPNFRQNAYYNQSISEYEQKLINLHLKSTIIFMFVYGLKMISRKFKNRKQSNKEKEI